MITLSKIAKMANVSVSTASKAFAGSGEVSEDTREMIFRVAKENGCFKKFYNVKYPKLVIALIAPEFNSMYYTRYLSVIKSKLDKENCELCVSTTDFSEENEKSLIEYYYKHSNVDGILVIGAQTEIAENYEIPVVHLLPGKEQTHGVSVWSDLQSALSEIGGYLARKGVDAVGFIGEQLTDKKRERLEKALKDSGLQLQEAFISISEDRFEAGGYSAMDALFAKKQLPRAVVCAYDYMAIGAIRCIYDHGLTVPGDIAVVGMDDIPEARYLNPPLASVSENTQMLCQMAAQSIMQQINGETVLQQQTVTAEFHLRESFELL